MIPLAILGILFANDQVVNTVSPPQTEVDTSETTASAKAAEVWLKLLDTQRYQESWNQASGLLRNLFSQTEWVQYVTAMRHSLGNVTKRTLAEQFPAPNPQGLPAGQYMVTLYSTTFGSGPAKLEMVMLQQTDKKEWRVVTYYLKST